MSSLDSTQTTRRTAMMLCADATRDELDRTLERLEAPAEVEDLRPAEIGLVMARGRIGGDGQPFNLGEVTVTRAAVRLAGGEVGFAYHLGRDRGKARRAAIVDALAQRLDAQRVLAALGPVADRRTREAAEAARRAAATRVNFFTLVRGED